MDKAYKGDVPRHKKALVELKREFSRVHTSTDWTRLRVDPLLQHVTSLEQLLRSPRFSREIARLRRGVGMFHADLVYLRTNIAVLKDILAAEKRSFEGTKYPKRRNRTAERTRAIARRTDVTVGLQNSSRI